MEMESVWGLGGLVLLRGESLRYRGFRAGLPGRKRRGAAMRPRLGVVSRDGNVRVLMLFLLPLLSSDSVEWEGRSLLKALVKKSALW